MTRASRTARCAAGLLAVAAACSLPAAPAQARFVTIGTGDVSGVYYAAGVAICRQVNKERARHGVRCSVEASGGSVYNAGTIGAGEMDMGIVQSDVAYKAYEGLPPFKAEPQHKLRSVLALHPEPLTLVTRPQAGITAFDQLRGKRLNVGNAGSGSRASLDELLQAQGWTLRDFAQITTLRPDQHGKALCENRIDAFFYGVGHPSDNVLQATRDCGARLAAVGGPAVERLLAQHNYYTRAVIPGGTYPNNPRDVASYGVVATLLASADVGDEMIYLVVKSVFENLDELKSQHPALAGLTAENMISAGLIAPLHPGAARYYRERGWR